MKPHACMYVAPLPRVHSPQANALKVIVVGLLVLALAIYVSMEFEAQLRRVNWSIVTGVCGGFAMIYLFYRGIVAQNTIDPWDMILDPVTRRVSFWRVLIAAMFGIGVWILGQWQIAGVPDDSDQIIYLYTTIIGSLVMKVASGEWADAKANRQPSIAAETPAPAQPAKQGSK